MVAFKERQNPSPYLQQSSTARAQTEPPTILRPKSPAPSERSFARSASLPAYPGNFQQASDPPVSTNRSVASLKRPKPSKRTTSRQARSRNRVQRIIRIINATYGLCRQWRLDTETRSLAYPVYQISERSFLIPATRADYRTLRSYIDRTDAANTSISFQQSASLPGRSTPTPCITVTMPKAGHEVAKACGTAIYAKLIAAKWKYMGEPLPITQAGSMERTLVRHDNSTVTQEPDDSYSVTGERYPFVVIEVRDSQPKKDLKNKVHRWLYYSKNQVKIACVFVVEAGSVNEYQILASIIKAEKRPSPTPQRPNRYRIQPVVVFDRVDISSQEHPGTFTISAAEVYPEEWPLDPAAQNNYVTISLASLHITALVAIKEKLAQMKRDAEEGGAMYNSDQEGVSTPSSSGSLEEEWFSGSELDDLDDGDYAP